jgi:hypothetical protein
MARTTATAVQTLLGEAYNSSYVVTASITTANLMVTKQCTDTAFTAAELEEIERYLAAYFYCLSHPRATEERAGSVSERKQHVEQVGLDANEFGTAAMVLDWSGKLSSLNLTMKKGLRRTVDFSWAGIKNPDQTTLDDILGI